MRDDRYARVAEWVDRTHLGGRLVYYRVLKARPGERAALYPASLANKVAIKPESEFYPWLDAELCARFNYVCCDTLEQFRREPQAVTRAGQSKGKGERHEKDDRHRAAFTVPASGIVNVSSLNGSDGDLQPGDVILVGCQNRKGGAQLKRYVVP